MSEGHLERGEREPESRSVDETWLFGLIRRAGGVTLGGPKLSIEQLEGRGEGSTDLVHRAACCALRMLASRFSKSNASRTTALCTGQLGGICGRENAGHMA